MKNLQASQASYEKLGFKQVMGDPTQNWLILRNGSITIGLFQGMFDRNTFTFNPGWTDPGGGAQGIRRCSGDSAEP